tara:strand:+ start:530 stop:1270 length:741 start_codon:yes stop_codon:yes gene_type:complete
MKITKQKLTEFIQEEIKTVLDKLDVKDEPAPKPPELKNIKIHSSGEHATLAVPGLRGRSKEDVKNYLMDLSIYPDKIGDGVVAFVRGGGMRSDFEGFFEELQQYDENWSEHLDTGRSFDLDQGEPGDQYPLLEKITKEQLESILQEEIEDALDEQEIAEDDDVIEEAGRCTKVTKKASSTRKGKKWMKCVKSDSGGYKRIHWGQKGVRVTGKSGNTKRKKSFKARHGCGKAKANTPKGQACKDWAE